MPGPQDPLAPPSAPGAPTAPAAPARRLASSSEFAFAVRKAYPGKYDHIQDDVLTHAFLQKYPVYQQHAVDLLGGGGMQAQPTPLPDGTFGLAKSVPPPQVDEGGIVHDAQLLMGRGGATGVGDMVKGLTGSVVRGGVRAVSGMAEAGRMLNQLPNDSGVVGPPPGAELPNFSAEEIARPAADIIGGVMEAGELGLIPAAIAAPWATAAALGVGTAAQTVTSKGLEMVGAPPSIAELGGDVAGLVAGGVAGHKVGARGEARMAGDQAMIDAAGESRAAVDMTDRENLMRQELGIETGRVEGDQARAAAMEAEAAQAAEAQAKKDEALSALAVNRGLLELAKEKEARARNKSPFDYLDQAQAATRAELAQLDAAREGLAQQTVDPSRMLPPSDQALPYTGEPGARAYSAEGPPADYDLRAAAPPESPEGLTGAPEGVEAPPVEVDNAGVGDPRTAELAGQVGDALGQQLEPVVEEDPFHKDVRVRAEIAQSVPEEMATNLADNPFEPESSGVLTGNIDQAGLAEERYKPRMGSAPIFRMIVGENNQTPPPVSVIADILRVFADTGAKSSVDIPGATHMRLRQAKGYGPREFLQAYDRWIPDVLRVHDEMVGSKVRQRQIMDSYQQALGGDRVGALRDTPEAAARRAGPPELPPEDSGPGGLPVGEGPPPPLDDMPADWLSEELGDFLTEGRNETQPPLPGAEGVREIENPTPEEDLPFSLERETTPGETPEQPSFWDALKSDVSRLAREDEGALKFPVDPNDESAVKRWLTGKLASHGHEPWYDAAQQALEEGDLNSATRIISIASAQSHMAEAATARKERTPERTAAAAVIDDAVERTRQAHKAQVEAQLGITLPKSVDMSPEGILTFQPGGKGVPALRARATDLTLAGELAGDITGKVDASQIIRMGTSDEVDAQFQVSKQIADQIAREFDDNTISDLADLMGFDHLDPAHQRLEVARQYSRTYSFAGRMLGELGNWTQKNQDLFYQLGPVNETGKIGELGSVGALQGSGIIDPDGFVHWLGKAATPEQLREMKFRLPEGVELKNAKGDLTPQAKIYAKNWFRRLERLAEVDKTIDRLIGEQGNALDRAVMATTIAPQVGGDGQGRLGAFNSLTKAALISRPGTMVRNAISQSGRYASGMADEALASFFSLATGDPGQATLHARNLRYLTQGLTRKGTSSLNLFKHPWADGLQAIYDYTEATISGLPASDARKSLSLLSEIPHEESRFLGALSLEGTRPDVAGQTSKYRAIATMQRGLDLITDPKVRNTLTLLNRVQEHFFRSAVFDSMLRAQIEARGLDPMVELAGDPRGLIDKVGAEEFDRMAGAAVSSALDYTFAADPLPGTAPAMILHVFQKTPVLSFLLQMGQPFPRFNFVSAPRWVWDHSPVAPVGDLMLLGFNALARSESASPAFRGRYHQMLQARAQESTMLDLDAQIGRGKYDGAKYLSDFKAARESERQADKVLKGITTRGRSVGELEALQGDLERIRGEQQAAKERAVVARAKWRETDNRVANLEKQRTRAKQTYRDLGAVGAAKSPQEYFARVTTGTAMMAAGYALWQFKADHSTTPGSPDSQWYELPMNWLPKEAQRLAGVENQAVDLRAFAPEVQHLFMPDVLADVQAHTDWSKLEPTKLADLYYISQYMKDHYSGKYTSQKFTKDALDAYLTISPASGSTRELMDILTGRSESGNSGVDPGAVQDVLLSMAGQYIGRLSSPLGAINDVVGQFSAEDAKARIPQEGTPENHSVLHELGDPTLANIPGARRMIPEKIDALSGRAVGGVDPIARQFAGVTKRVMNRVNQELQATGVSYSQAVPRQTGDREFDNAVNAAYAKLLNEYFPQILDDPDYQRMTPELKRDALANGIPGQNGQPGQSAKFAILKKAALQQAIEDLGKDPELLRSPDVQAKQRRWQAYAEAEDQRLAPATQDNDREQAAEEPEVGAPPTAPP